MDRREALKFTALWMGVGLSASSVSAILAGCNVDDSDEWSPTFFTSAQAVFIDELSETMLPRTSTPGGKDAMVVRYLDTVRPLRYSAEDNDFFTEKLSQFMDESRTTLGMDLIKATPEHRLAWLTDVDKNAFEYAKENPDRERPFYLALKEQILGGYFSSEIVAKEFFAFDPIPGRYDACIPYEEIGKQWAL